MAATSERMLAGPTPCEDFDVRTLMGHLIGTAERSLGTAEGRPTNDIPHVVVDVGDDDLAGRYVELADQVITAWAYLAPGQEVTAPWGACSAEDALGGFTIETVVHGWDLAVATDQPEEASDGLVDYANAQLDRVVPEGTRARKYAAAWTPADGAGPTERLANALGHHR
jgi:uncharacterized protein (TIGR03086 family)